MYIPSHFFYFTFHWFVLWQLKITEIYAPNNQIAYQIADILYFNNKYIITTFPLWCYKKERDWNLKKKTVALYSIFVTCPSLLTISKYLHSTLLQITITLWPCIYCSCFLCSCVVLVLACCSTYLAFLYNFVLASLEV